jgi:DDE superfamily endonuclease
MRLCLENKIILLYLPPHTSHVLQPLDLSIFASFKALYKKAARKLIGSADLTRVSKAQFIQIYFEIRPKCMSSSNIEGGWRKSGIYPLDSQVPLDSPFMKEQIAKEQLQATQNTSIEPAPAPVAAVLSERDMRTKIRNLEAENRVKTARIAYLETQLTTVNNELTQLRASKKRKKIPAPTSNEKLTSFATIVGTQAAQDLEEEEERLRAARRAKKAKK